MVSYADFDRMPARRRKAMEYGLHDYLEVPKEKSIYLDNGAFYFLKKDGEVPREDYEVFVQKAKPDWYAIPQDYIPTPRMDDVEQLDCLERTMEVNREYQGDGYVPVIHISRQLDEYLRQFQESEELQSKPSVALGGIVPNLLRAPKAMSYTNVLDKLRQVRNELSDHQLHVFGIGGTATLHLAALLDIDSVDSSGWRNRAARGIVQLPGSGDRVVAELGNWRGRRPDDAEWEELGGCRCPACNEHGLDGLKANRIFGFCNRATHNLWTLLEEIKLVTNHLNAGTYVEWYEEHLDNSIYLPLINRVIQTLRGK